LYFNAFDKLLNLNLKAEGYEAMKKIMACIISVVQKVQILW
jgi:hypothetical protein